MMLSANEDVYAEKICFTLCQRLKYYTLGRSTDQVPIFIVFERRRSRALLIFATTPANTQRNNHHKPGGRYYHHFGAGVVHTVGAYGRRFRTSSQPAHISVTPAPHFSVLSPQGYHASGHTTRVHTGPGESTRIFDRETHTQSMGRSAEHAQQDFEIQKIFAQRIAKPRS
ncbi:hypothetical protein V9T40_003476 [Parthenolecanium corni]|uniref:Uncharacterized protein n=1 Tax=Parthenolecanium corni TaxID=536013 RepID=A0AAN9TT84_9HEMI